MKFLSVAVLALSCIDTAQATFTTSFLKLKRKSELRNRRIQSRDVDPTTLYPVHSIDMPIDHFHNDSRYAPHSNGMFKQHYYFDASHYKPGGPVIMLASGEDSGSDRLPFLQKGIVYKLAKATGGLGVILEHRYYGLTFPTPDLSVENLRFLTTDQAMADAAYFAQNIKFPGMESTDLSSNSTAWIAYGGSYAGAFAAFLRVLYPKVFWGAIGSSGVVEAIADYWQYYEPIKTYAPHACVKNTQYLQNAIDNILMKPENKALIPTLQDVFNMGNISHPDDFTNALSGYGIGWWQSKNWDPAINYPDFDYYCSNVSSNNLIYNNTASKKATVQKLLTAGGYGSMLNNLTNPMLNWIGFAQSEIVDSCTSAGETLDQCYSTHNQTFYNQQDTSQSVWRSWSYQYCSQWGFLQTGSGVPSNELSLISRTITLPFTEIVCRDAFNITTPPDVAYINRLGGYNISYERLAFLDGEIDPWRPACVHAPEAQPWNRTNSVSQPFILIANAVHHYDENGLFPNETTPSLPPRPVGIAQAVEEEFVKAWVEEFQSGKTCLS